MLKDLILFNTKHNNMLFVNIIKKIILLINFINQCNSRTAEYLVGYIFSICKFLKAYKVQNK